MMWAHAVRPKRAGHVAPLQETGTNLTPLPEIGENPAPLHRVRKEWAIINHPQKEMKGAQRRCAPTEVNLTIFHGAQMPS